MRAWRCVVALGNERSCGCHKHRMQKTGHSEDGSRMNQRIQYGTVQVVVQSKANNNNKSSVHDKRANSIQSLEEDQLDFE